MCSSFQALELCCSGGEVGEEQVGAPLVCEGLGRAGCGMDALGTGQRNDSAALLLLQPWLPDLQLPSHLPNPNTCFSPSPSKSVQLFRGRTLLVVCASAAATTSLVLFWCQAVVMDWLLVLYKHKPKAEWGKIAVHPSSCFFLTFSEIT